MSNECPYCGERNTAKADPDVYWFNCGTKISNRGTMQPEICLRKQRDHLQSQLTASQARVEALEKLINRLLYWRHTDNAREILAAYRNLEAALAAKEGE